MVFSTYTISRFYIKLGVIMVESENIIKYIILGLAIAALVFSLIVSISTIMIYGFSEFTALASWIILIYLLMI